MSDKFKINAFIIALATISILVIYRIANAQIQAQVQISEVEYIKIQPDIMVFITALCVMNMMSVLTTDWPKSILLRCCLIFITQWLSASQLCFPFFCIIPNTILKCKAMKTDVIKRNFFRLIRSGALNEFESLEPMSAFKWNQLMQYVKAQNVLSIVQKGIKNHQYDEGMNVPPILLADLTQATDTHPTLRLPTVMSNPVLNKRLRNIQENERHEIDASVETIELLNMIVRNAYALLNRDIALCAVLELGVFLRTRGNKVDFVKLDRWLSQLHLRRMARLEGSLLISLFQFEQAEIPFVERLEAGATQLALRSLETSVEIITDEWHFKQSRSGFVQNNPVTLKRNLRRSIRCIRYAPIETVSSFISNFTHSLSEIEE